MYSEFGNAEQVLYDHGCSSSYGKFLTVSLFAIANSTMVWRLGVTTKLSVCELRGMIQIFYLWVSD